MNHQFNLQVATQFGVEIAIFLENLAFWTHRNIANKKNYIQNRYWIYNTQLAWTDLFPYWSRQNIRTIISNCEKQGLIIKNNTFNKRRGDTTYWYSLTDKCIELFPLIKCLLEKDVSPPENEESYPQPMVSSNQAMVDSNHVPMVSSNQALPDNKPDNKQHIKSFYKNEQKINDREKNLKKHEWAANKKEELRCTVKEWGAGHPTWDSIYGSKNKTG